MAEKNINDTELSGEQTTQKKKTTSKKKAESENIKAEKPTTKKKAKAKVTDAAETAAPVETVAEDVAEETTEAVIEDVAEETTEAAIEDVAEETAEAVIEDSAEETAEAVIEDVAEETTEAVVEDVAEETTEAVVDTPTTEESEEDSLPLPIMDIEHFSDYKSTKEASIEEALEEAVEEAETPEETVAEEASEDIVEEAQATDENEENLPDAEEYENLTILDHGLFEEAIPDTSDNTVSESDSVKEELPEDPDSQKYDPKKPRRVDGRFEFVELFVFTLVAVMLITTFLFRHSVVEGESMENTLFANEHLIITDVFYKPKAGDIIVFEDYSTGYTTAIVKRVIATEGQTVRIAKEGVYVDGVFLDNEYYAHADTENYNYLTKVDPQFTTDYTIPEGEVFVMGDHRDHSSDSRTFGTISEETILGKVILRFYPFDKFGSVYKDN